MLNQILTVTAALALLAPQLASAATETLQPSGQLNCYVSRTDTDNRPLEASRLECRLHLDSADEPVKVRGRLFGTGLNLAMGEENTTVWDVYAVRETISSEALRGDYDIVSQFAFQLPDQRKNVLVGGERDTIALKLKSPKLDAVDPATRLTLELDPTLKPGQGQDDTFRGASE